METSREIMQEEVVEAFMALEKKRALAVIGTGGGKTRIAMMIIQRLKPKQIIFLSDSTIGRDVTLPAEMRKWGLGNLVASTGFHTYQAAYKWTKKDIDLTGALVIADEVDFALTQKYGKFFKEFDNVDIFGMTGFIPDGKKREFEEHLPLLVNISREELQERKIVNKSKFIFVQYCLSKVRDINVPYKSNGEEKMFKQSENGSYVFIEEQFQKYQKMLLTAEINNDFKTISKCEYMLNNKLFTMRTNLLLNLKSSADLTAKLKAEILSEPGTKVITFSHRTAQADKLSKHTYHGKNKNSVNDKNFIDFNLGRIREMAVCQKINRTANMVGLTHAILESYVGSEVAANQRNGRMLRLEQDQISTIFVLLPYYIANIDGKNELKPTQAVSWAREMLSRFNLKKEDWELRNYCGLEIGKIT